MSGTKRWRVAVAIALVAASGCAASRPAFEPADLDSGLHAMRATPLSERRPHPSAEQLARPVVIVTHGFSSTTWEVGPVSEALTRRGLQVSAVTLGAHGVSLEAFTRSDWRAWRAPLLAEFRALRAQGYRHISVLGHSTGGTLWLKALADGSLTPMPERMVFVSPLIEFASRTRGIYLAGVLPWVGIKAVERPLRGGSVGHLYRWRPVSTLESLAEVTTLVRRRLERGLALPAASRVLVVQGDGDDIVEPEGARLLADGLVGPTPRLLMVKSWMHNPIGPDGIQGHRFTPEEAALRERLIEAIVEHLSAPN